MKLSVTIGDIVVTENSQAFEVKFNHPIIFNHLSEAIEKLKALPSDVTISYRQK
ncbi:MAG: hypothetical protein VW729_02565 [Deltaproteobacteria bacterium]